MEKLIEELRKRGVLHSESVILAFSKIDRADFVPPEYRKFAYLDEALPIGYGQTISQPYTVAFMLELLEAGEGMRVLDLGSGSGWTTALLSNIVGPRGRVHGVEIVPELVVFGRKNLKKYDSGNANIEQAGEKLGLSKEAPFDRILVSASGGSVPEELLLQLAVSGVVVIPVGNSIVKIRKISEEEITEEIYHGFAFVPLVEN